MRVVVALGGNALLRRGERPDAAVQLSHVRAAAHALAPLAREHELVLCHGNGPQVGLLALESQRDEVLSQPYPLDALGAQTQGIIGYWLAQALHNERPGKPVVTVVTQTVVDAADPAFDSPSKLIGPGYDEAEAARLAGLYGWRTARDGDRVRRVVASPRPTGFVELDAVVRLLATPAS